MIFTSLMSQPNRFFQLSVISVALGAGSLGASGCSCDDDGGGKPAPDDGGTDGSLDGDTSDADTQDASPGDDQKLTLGGGSSASADSILWALPDEPLARAAARFSTPSVPFTITKIVYRIANEDLSATDRNVECGNMPAHAVGIGQRDFIEPPVNNNVVFDIDDSDPQVTITPSTVNLAGEGEIDALTVTVELDEPFVVTKSSFFVVHEFATDVAGGDNHPVSTCLFLKDGTEANRDRNYFSTDDGVAYITLYDFNDMVDEPLDQDIQVEVYGFEAE